MTDVKEPKSVKYFRWLNYFWIACEILMILTANSLLFSSPGGGVSGGVLAGFQNGFIKRYVSDISSYGTMQASVLTGKFTFELLFPIIYLWLLKGKNLGWLRGLIILKLLADVGNFRIPTAPLVATILVFLPSFTAYCREKSGRAPRTGGPVDDWKEPGL